MDCGGPNCNQCDNGKECENDRDCISENCESGKCLG